MELWDPFYDRVGQFCGKKCRGNFDNISASSKKSIHQISIKKPSMPSMMLIKTGTCVLSVGFKRVKMNSE